MEKVNKEVRPKVAKEFGLNNINSAPQLQKVVVNVGIRSDLKDARIIDEYVKDLKTITGQAPVKTVAKKSISSFKLREGQVNGLMVTLRGKRMYDFLNKILNVSLARVRDFRGLDPKGFDKSGNYSIGFRDQTAFPEISAESASHLFGFQVTVALEAKTPEQAKTFLTLIGFPFKK